MSGLAPRISLVMAVGRPTNYSRDELGRSKGTHSETIAGILGYARGEEVIQRDNMVLF